MDSSTTKTSFDCILFDLDDTLYSSSIGISAYMRKNIEDFLVQKFGFSAKEACRLRSELFGSHGSSLAGLRAQGHNVHPDEYHSFVHGKLPYELIAPNPRLREALLSIPQTKMIFTNSDREHVRKSLQRLGIEESIFKRIICFETINPHLFSSSPLSSPVVLKPAVSAVETAIEIAGFNPHRVLFLDDNERNLATGKALGLCTALVGKKVKSKEADYLVENINNLKESIPEIWSCEVVEEKAGASVGIHDMIPRNDLDSIITTTTSVEA